MRFGWLAGATALVGALVAAGVPQARATLYDWSYSDLAGDNGSGTLTTSGTTSPFTLTAITGTFNSLAITGAPIAFDGADNSIFVPAPYLDIVGIGFALTGGEDVDIFFAGNGPKYGVNLQITPTDRITNEFGDFTLTLAPTAVPEPGSIALLGTALAGLGLIRRRRKRVS